MRCHWKIENLLRKNGKGRDSAAESYRLKYEATGLIFLFGYVGNIRVFDTFGDWRDEEKRRKRRGSAAGSTCFKHKKYQGVLISEGRLRERERKEDVFEIVFFFFIFPSFMEILLRFLAFGRGCEGEKKGKKRTL